MLFVFPCSEGYFGNWNIHSAWKKYHLKKLKTLSLSLSLWLIKEVYEIAKELLHIAWNTKVIKIVVSDISNQVCEGGVILKL